MMPSWIERIALVLKDSHLWRYNSTGMKTTLILLWMIGVSFSLSGRCHHITGLIWTGYESTISLNELSVYGAPMLWFSPDEPDLFDSKGHIQIPKPLPYDKDSDIPVAYYKVRMVYTNEKKHEDLFPEDLGDIVLDLSQVRAIDLEYYFYYTSETGLGGHPHDIESVALQLQVINARNCPDYNYAIQVKRVIARAHGLYWFENAFTVDQQTVFPLSILVEEGKHANCTDKNADGIYTPSFDVTEKVNDAWGVRDIISSGKLFSGGYQAWMTKRRENNTILFPPLPKTSPHYASLRNKYGELIERQHYKLRPFVDNHPKTIGDDLKKMVRDKKPKKWPKHRYVSGDGSILQWSKESKLHKKIGVAYRFDEDNSLSFTLPLLLLKNVEAPMTGGWFYHKIYFGNGDSFNGRINRSFGHQIQHTSSASRWLDTYVGAGYEIVDDNDIETIIQHKAYMVTELGMKIRFNITKTPLGFLKFLGTDYWGLRLGWKNLGFNPFVYSGFVLEIGAGVF